jgi:hypothetical protein
MVTGAIRCVIPPKAELDDHRNGFCWTQSLPVGAIAGQPLPVFCSIKNKGPDTSISGVNSWIDDFNHNLSFADFSGTAYVVFEKVGFIHKTIHWRHADHWMVDTASHDQTTQPGWVRGGALLRPDRSFRFENGKFVVEAMAAAGIEPYGTNVWSEIVISTSPSPYDVGSLYAYDLFPEGLTIGCRLQATRYPVCSFKDDDGEIKTGKGSTRIWEMSAHQEVGTENYGGSPFEGRENAWRVCVDTDPDMYCRDNFRLELTPTSLTLFVNGVKYFEQKNIPVLDDEFTSGDLYVYFASMVVSHPAEAIRFHWDEVKVNPELMSMTGLVSSQPNDENDKRLHIR